MDNNENFTNDVVETAETTTTETPTADNNGKSTNATAILVLGILSIVCCAPCGIAALIMYLTGKDNVDADQAGKAKAGFICSIIGLALWVVGIILTATSGYSLANYM